MGKNQLRRTFILIVIGLCSFISIAVQETIQHEAFKKLKEKCPKVYLDCSYCDSDYIRTEITFVNYVWDRKEADVHILITTQSTGAGGREYTISLIGQGKYDDFKNTLKHYTTPDDTDDEIRTGLVKILKLGLVSLTARTPMASQLDISLKNDTKITDIRDKWNFWVFSIGFNSWFNGESTYKSVNLGSNISANRVTNESKLRLGLSYYYDRSTYNFEDTELISSSNSQHFNGYYVKSLGKHWSAGFIFDVNSSTYSNNKISLNVSPAVEYNIFPYSKSTRRQLCFLYSIGYTYANYHEETIYDKTSENLYNQSLCITLELKEQWGTIETSLSGSHYLHDLSKNHLQISGDLSIKLIKGLSLNFFGRYSRIHNQLSLSKAGATLEEILLRRKELETSYYFYGYVSLSYRFGSTSSNVVNPRFGKYYYL